MIPDFLEQLDALPLLPSGKADRKALPPPSGPRRLSGTRGHVPPESAAEQELAELLADALGVPEVSVVSDFFADLGADSLLMARFNAAVRRRPGWSALSMRHVYSYPTIRQLAAALGQRGPAGRAEGDTTDATRRSGADLPNRRTIGKPHYALCGLLQIAAFAGCALACAWALDLCAGWVLAAHGAVVIAIRGVLAGAAATLIIGTLPIAAKWLLIGRWKEQRLAIWSLAYVRFWITKTLISWNPLAMLCVGSPPYVLYLRALGARIGPGAVIFSRHIPVCTDLLTIGAGSVIRRGAYLNCYRADRGLIETGAVTLGSGVFIGEATVLDIGTTVGDNGQIGHASSLHQGQSVPAGQCWHGSPARQAEAGYDYRMPSGALVSRARRVRYGIMRLIVALLISGPLAFIVSGLVLSRPAPLYLWFGSPDLAGLGFYRDALVISTMAFFGAIVVMAAVTATVPRFLSRIVSEGQIYPLYGWRYTIQRAVTRLSNVPFFTALFGDSSAIVGYLQFIGYTLAPVEQTGSNFGMTVRHDVPWLCAVGTGTMVSDGLTFMNAEYSAGSFRVRPAAIGPRNFLGNGVVYPADGRTGANCMMATKVMVPTSGPVRENVGLLGSPCFEVPRSVRRDRAAGTEEADSPAARRAKLAAKARHNAATAALYVLIRWVFVTGVVIIGMLPLHIRGRGEALSTFLAICLELIFTAAYFTLVERAVTGFKGLRPRMCSIYHVDFWRHERYWKLPDTAFTHFFNGTPFKSILWRLLGVKIGRRLFDDGCAIIERTLVSVGDEATLNAGSTLSGHSMEDGTFKSDYISIGARCTIGTGAFVHYGAVMEEGSSLAADSFLMKGEQIAAQTAWAGNPAAELTSPESDRQS